MLKYQTKASIAEKQAMDILRNEIKIHKPWSFVSSKLHNRTLQTTSAEVPIIYKDHANVRPGFEVADDSVYVPNLFVKISGYEAAMDMFSKPEMLKQRENCFVYESITDFSNMAGDDQDFEQFLDENGQILKEKLVASDKYHFSFLRREHQNILIDKMNEILSKQSEFFISQMKTIERKTLLSYMLGMDEKLMKGYNNFDFQFQPPSVIIYNQGMERVTDKQACILALLNLLGFDIILVSNEGYSDIENVLNPDLYNIYYGEKKVARKSRVKKSIIGRIAAIVVVAVIIGFTGKLLVQNIFDKPASNPVQGNQVESLVSPAPAKRVELNGRPIVFKDQNVEVLTQMITEKKNEKVYQEDVAPIRSLRFIGKTGGADGWDFITGYSQEYYHDKFGGMHNEEGSIGSLADLVNFPNLSNLEVSWQSNIDCKTITRVNWLEELTFMHNHLQDVSWLSEMKTLSSINLGYNQISDISPLSKLERLNVVQLDGNNITDITPLSSLPNLRTLFITFNPISDLSPLKNNSNLKTLVAYNTPVSDFSFLKKMKQLQTLNLGRTGMTDISALKDLINLEVLDLSDNPIHDIKNLTNLKKLKHLNLGNTKVRDLQVLKQLPSLYEVIIYNVELNKDDEEVLKELEESANVKIVK